MVREQTLKNGGGDRALTLRWLVVPQSYVLKANALKQITSSRSS